MYNSNVILSIIQSSLQEKSMTLLVSYWFLLYIYIYIYNGSLFVFWVWLYAESHAVSHLHETQENQITRLVRLKLDGIRFLIVGSKHLDYSTDSCITPACICTIRLDSEFAFCVMIMYAIYETYKDVSSYAIFLECRGRGCFCWWRKEVNRRWLYHHWLKWVQRHLSYRVWHPSANNCISSPACILGQLQLSDRVK